MTTASARVWLGLGGALVVCVAPARAQPAASADSTTRWAEATPPPIAYAAASYAYMDFASESVRQAYANLASFGIGGMMWLRQRPGFAFELRYASGRGRPTVTDPTWTYEHTAIEMWILALDISYLHRLFRDIDAHLLLPYAGAGIDYFLGFEEIEARARRTGERLDGRVPAVRGAFGGHALAGLQVRFGRSTALALEARRTWTLDGSLSEMRDEASAEEKSFFAVFDPMLRRPDYNFTGWSARLGVLVQR